MMKTYTVNGVKIVGYTIGDLAARLGRSSLTVRKWERDGIIPPPFLWTQKGRTPWRIYTSDEVNAVVLAAAEEKLTEGKSFASTRFSEKVKRSFNLIHLNLREVIHSIESKRHKEEKQVEKPKFDKAALNRLLGLEPPIREEKKP